MDLLGAAPSLLFPGASTSGIGVIVQARACVIQVCQESLKRTA